MCYGNSIEAPSLASCSALHHVPGITPGVGLLWPLLTSARSPVGLLPPAQPACGRVRWRFRIFRSGPQSGSHDMAGRKAGQISPDKDVNCRDTTAAFTVSPEPGALSCCADLPGDSALYAVSVRRLIALYIYLPSDTTSRRCPCPRLMFMSMLTINRVHT